MKVNELYEEMNSRVNVWNYDFYDITMKLSNIKTKEHIDKIRLLLMFISWYEENVVNSNHILVNNET